MYSRDNRENIFGSHTTQEACKVISAFVIGISKMLKSMRFSRRELETKKAPQRVLLISYKVVFTKTTKTIL